MKKQGRIEQHNDFVYRIKSIKSISRRWHFQTKGIKSTGLNAFYKKILFGMRDGI